MRHRALNYFILLSFAAVLCSLVASLAMVRLPRGAVGSGGPIGLTLMVTVLSVSHAIYALGWRHALAFFGIAVIISWAFEHVGVATGTIYGGYYYTELLGARLGNVPVLIPLSWFEYLYCSYIAVNYILLDRAVGTRVIAHRAGVVGWFLLLSLATAALTAAQDLVIDPIMSGDVVQAWVWETPGSYYGVPALNFVGWFVTAFLAVSTYRLLELWMPPRPGESPSRGMMTIPIILYGMNILVSMAPFAPPGLKVLGPFVIGPPVLLALGRIWLPNPRRGVLYET